MKGLSCGVTVLLAISLLSLTVSASGTAGVNDDPPLEGTDVVSVTHDNVSVDGLAFHISFVLSDEALDNGTSVEMKTQICVNNGFCHPPEVMELSQEGSSFSGEVTPMEDHTYVNWRITLTYTDSENETKIPESGFATTWSNCWFFEEAWGGDGCPTVGDDEEPKSDSIPALSSIAVLATLSVSAMLIRQREC